MAINRIKCLRILELPDDAPDEQVRTSYRELVNVWHPDRFEHDPKLKHRAEEKLKEINIAYEWLKTHPGAESGPAENRSEPGPGPTYRTDGSEPARPYSRQTAGYFAFVLLAVAIFVGFAAWRMKRWLLLPLALVLAGLWWRTRIRRP
jgi:curved DNA-binding protein CbpA